MPGENVPTSRITKWVPFEFTSKFTRSAVFADSFTNSIFMPELVVESGIPPIDGPFDELELSSAPQLFIVIGEPADESRADTKPVHADANSPAKSKVKPLISVDFQHRSDGPCHARRVAITQLEDVTAHMLSVK